MRKIAPRWTLVLLALFAAALVAGACSGDGGNDAYGERSAIEVSGMSVTVELKGIQFRPQGIRVKPGTTVTWVNKDPVIHNVRQVESVFLSPDVVQPGDTFSHTFDTPGKYRYQCTFHHPNMNGVVIVEEG
jgi:plastocyanin